MTLSRRPMDRSNLPLRSAIERLIGDWPMLPIEGMTELAPPIDVRETEDAYIVEIDLPGVDPDEVEVLLEGRTLTIRGRFSREDERREGNYLLRERRRGEFLRAVALPGMVEPDQVDSAFENGQLVITLPKARQNRARRIAIGHDGGAHHDGGTVTAGTAVGAGTTEGGGDAGMAAGRPTEGSTAEGGTTERGTTDAARREMGTTG